jgi:hypothetical protein
MVAARRIIDLSVASEQRQRLVEISRSRTEPANRVERCIGTGPVGVMMIGILSGQVGPRRRS